MLVRFWKNMNPCSLFKGVQIGMSPLKFGKRKWSKKQTHKQLKINLLPTL